MPRPRVRAGSHTGGRRPGGHRRGRHRVPGHRSGRTTRPGRTPVPSHGVLRGRHRRTPGRPGGSGGLRRRARRTGRADRGVDQARAGRAGRARAGGRTRRCRHAGGRRGSYGPGEAAHRGRGGPGRHPGDRRAARRRHIVVRCDGRSGRVRRGVRHGRRVRARGAGPGPGVRAVARGGGDRRTDPPNGGRRGTARRPARGRSRRRPRRSARARTAGRPRRPCGRSGRVHRVRGRAGRPVRGRRRRAPRAARRGGGVPARRADPSHRRAARGRRTSASGHLAPNPARRTGVGRSGCAVRADPADRWRSGCGLPGVGPAAAPARRASARAAAHPVVRTADRGLRGGDRPDHGMARARQLRGGHAPGGVGRRGDDAERGDGRRRTARDHGAARYHA